jgi:hypothetical protein
MPRDEKKKRFIWLIRLLEWEPWIFFKGVQKLCKLIAFKCCNRVDYPKLVHKYKKKRIVVTNVICSIRCLEKNICWKIVLVNKYRIYLWSFCTSFYDFTQGAPHINKKGSSAGILLVLVLFEEQQKKICILYNKGVHWWPMGKNIVGEHNYVQEHIQ